MTLCVVSRRVIVAIFLAVISVVWIHARKNAPSLPALSETIGGYTDIDSVKTRLLALGMHSTEGIWQFSADGATIAIERAPVDPSNPAAVSYRLVLLRSPRRAISPGTVMGVMVATGKKGVFRASIYTSTVGVRRLSSPRQFTLTFDGNDRFVMKPDKGPLRLRLNFWHLIPYLSGNIALRANTRDDSADDSFDGAFRLFPTPAVGIFGPRYL